eukprot:GEMP01080773.1.p1 GENE.GEMP01080773.1~~GEMP01080773.1.p1  ORF type:complete len:193 (+),score=11.17 GEMP01080773.1:296-874(+)
MRIYIFTYSISYIYFFILLISKSPSKTPLFDSIDYTNQSSKWARTLFLPKNPEVYYFYTPLSAKKTINSLPRNQKIRWQKQNILKHMIAVIYRVRIQPGKEQMYQECWRVVADFFVAHRGALGSRLHQAADGWFVIYSSWPDNSTRQASWPGEDAPSDVLPDRIRQAILHMKDYVVEKDEEMLLDVIEDKFT